jgi:uncharacterized protein
MSKCRVSRCQDERPTVGSNCGSGDNMLRAKWNALRQILQKHKRVLVAFSGGCDSSFLLAAARHTLGRENLLAVTAVSASLPQKEIHSTRRLAAQLDVPHLAIETHELDNPAYTSNPSNRCFFCKEELFETLAPIATVNRMTTADGFNVSDRADYRPGFQASQKWHVIHPLDDANLTKHEIRVLSRWMGLPTWNKPASPCLSSRIPYGTPVTKRILKQIETAEDVIRSEGFSVVRMRHYGSEARIEVPLSEFPRLTETRRWQRVTQDVKACGYETVVADPRGFKSGRLNENISPRAMRNA